MKKIFPQRYLTPYGRYALTLEERLMAHREIQNGCWLWTGNLYRGYGRMEISKCVNYRKTWKKYLRVHRVAWRIFKGPILKGKLVLHRCDTPACFNPEHLFLGTHTDNHKDMVKKRRHAFGSRNGSSKLTEKNIPQIRRLLEAGIPQRRIARQFRISQRNILDINKQRIWKHVLCLS